MSYFKTIEISDPRFERDGLRQLTVKSRALKGRGDVSIFVPQEAGVDVPLVLLLHGVYGSHWAWAMKGGAHWTLRALMAASKLDPCVLVMPSDGLWGDGSGYVAHPKQDFEQWIVEEVPRAVREMIGQATADSPMFLAGLSMGGYGAMRLGAKYPD
ncbi:MAG: alpha/beta hydrolase-fold protein, partial [Bacteroidota bacterium]